MLVLDTNVPHGNIAKDKIASVFVSLHLRERERDV